MSRSRFTEQYAFINELNSMMKRYAGIGYNESFDYQTVVECIRVSDVGSVFDFEHYDRDISRGRRPTLRSKPFRWKDAYNNTFLDAYLEVEDFIRREGKIDNHFVPHINLYSETFRSYNIWYRTIPQLVEGLIDIIELLSRKSQEYIREEEEFNEKRRRRQEILETIPDLIKTAMKKEKIMFDIVDNNDDTVTMSFKMPKKTKLSVRMKISQISNDLHYIVSMILPEVSTYESAHRFTVSGYGNNVTWKEVVK